MKLKKMILVGFLLVITGCRSLYAQWAVTVVGNVDPGELIHRVQELGTLASQLAQAEQMVQQTTTMVKFAGDPKSAMQNLGPLESIANTTANIVGGDNVNQLTDISSAMSPGQVQFSSPVFKGIQGNVSVFGTAQPRNPNLYTSLNASSAINADVQAKRQNVVTALAAIDAALAANTKKLRNAPDENSREAARAERAALEGERAKALADEQEMMNTKKLEDDQVDQTATANALGKQEQQDAMATAGAQGMTAQMEANRAAAVQTIGTLSDTPTDWGSSLKLHLVPPTN